MKTVTCDRCNRTTPLVPDSDPKHKGMLLYPNGWLHNVFHEMGSDVGQVFDLCGDCKSALMAWIRKGKDDK